MKYEFYNAFYLILFHSFAGFAVEIGEMLEIQIIKVEHYMMAVSIRYDATSNIILVVLGYYY